MSESDVNFLTQVLEMIEYFYTSLNDTSQCMGVWGVKCIVATAIQGGLH